MSFLTKGMLAVALMLLPGCVSIHVLRVGEYNYPPRPEDYPIAIYEIPEDIREPYKKLAVLDAAGDSLVSWNRVFEALKATYHVQNPADW